VLRGPAEQLETEPSPSLGELAVVLEKVRCAGMPVEFRLEGTPYPLAPGIEVTAYRIVQEALTNTVRHAPHACAEVTLSYEPGLSPCRSVIPEWRPASARTAAGLGAATGPRSAAMAPGAALAPGLIPRSGSAPASSAWPASQSESPPAAAA
jgi:hypothetical protein